MSTTPAHRAERKEVPPIVFIIMGFSLTLVIFGLLILARDDRSLQMIILGFGTPFDTALYVAAGVKIILQPQAADIAIVKHQTNGVLSASISTAVKNGVDEALDERGI